MRVLLLQDQVHVPSLGGGNKTTRMLLEGLARRGHACSLVAPALTTRAGPTTEPEFEAEMAKRGIVPDAGPDAYSYRWRGVDVLSLRQRLPEGDGRTRWQSVISRRIAQWGPDWPV